jgi:uncharacterized protein (TIGR02145 family)
VCYGNEESNCEIYGRLYNWATAKEACPAGWHLPNNDEWDILMNYVQTDNGSTYTSNSNASIAGKYLKATSGWKSGNGEDKYGFAALPGGSSNYPNFFNVGDYGNWWSADGIDNNNAYQRLMYSYYERVDLSQSNKTFLRSVRCVQGDAEQ